MERKDDANEVRDAATMVSAVESSAAESGAASSSSYRRLPGGRGLAPKEVAADQRARLQRAMIEASAERGYPEVKVGDVVALAGVSKSAFYGQFAGKEECFLASYDALVGRLLSEVAQAAEGEAAAALRAGLGRVFELAIGDPSATAFVVVESLTLGAAGLRSRERAAKALEGQLAEIIFERARPGAGSAATTIRALIQGINNMIYRALRGGNLDSLREQGEELVEWALSYLGRAPDKTVRQVVEGEGRLLWGVAPNSSSARIKYSQRERITQAVVRLAGEGGSRLSIPEISAAAGVSNAAFYKNFANKREALLAPFDAFVQGSAEAALPAFAAAGSWEESVRAGIEASIDFIAAEPEFAWVAYVEVSVSGAAALDHVDDAIAIFETLLAPESGAPKQLPEVVIGAIIGGIFGSIQLAIGEGQLARMREHTPELLDFVLAPFDLEG